MIVSLRDICGVCLIILFLVFLYPLIGDPGVGWHLRAGELMVRERSVISTDPFLQHQAERAWVHDQWLSDVVFWGLYSIGGVGLLHCSMLGLAILSYVAILGELTYFVAGSEVISFLVLMLLAPIVSMQWFVRPVIFSFVFFLCVYAISYYSIATKKPFRISVATCLGLLFILWSNLHPSFVLGLIVLAVAMVSLCISNGSRKVIELFFLTFCLGALGTLCSPYGMDLHVSIVRLMNNKLFMQLNKEWLSPNFWEAPFLPGLILVFFSLPICFWLFKVGDPFHCFLLGIFGFLALSGRRGLPYFAIVAAVPLTKIIQQSIRDNRKFQSIFSLPENFLSTRLFSLRTVRFTIMTYFAVTLCRSYKSDRYIEHNLPLELSSLRQSGESVQGNLFHSPDLGGIITWSMWPAIRATIDDRNQVCSIDDYQRYFTLALGRPGWREHLHGVQWLILHESDPLRWLLSGEQWSRVDNSSPEDKSGLRLYRSRQSP